MSRSSKTPRKTSSRLDEAPSPDPRDPSALAPTTPEHAPHKPAIPTGTRRLWLLAAFGFLLSAGLPWSCKGSPVQWIVSWASFPGWGDRALAMHGVVPLLMLVAVASRETAPRVWPRMSVATMSFFALAALAVPAFSESLPTRPQLPGAPLYQDLPRIIRAYEGWARHVVRALIFVPPALVAGWALAGRGSVRAPLANRLLLGLLCAGLTLLWAPKRTDWGYWVGLSSSLALLALSARVPDEPPALEPRQRNQITLALVLWFALTATLALTRARRS